MSTEPLSSGLDRLGGILLGAAVGDALGWPQEDRSKIVGGNAARHIDPTPEFRDWVRHGGTRYAGYLDPVRAGEYSDDTQLMLAVARACLHGGDWLTWLTTVELPQWPLYERGGGGAVLRASRAWAKGQAPWQINTDKDVAAANRYFQAGGNGVAMRIAPHAIIAVVDGLTPDDLAARVVHDGLATHGHPHALLGGVLHAAALAHALTRTGTLEYGEMLDRLLADRSWTDPAVMMDTASRDWHRAYQAVNRRRPAHPAMVWEEAADQTLRSLTIARETLDRGTLANDHTTLEAIGCFDERRSGAGTVAAAAALYVASRSASRPVSGLLRTAFLHGSDTDTIASMTGSLLGAIHGTPWLGQMGRQVQDSEYLLEIAGALPGRGHLARSPSDTAVTEASLRRWGKHLLAHDADRLPDGRYFTVQTWAQLEAKSDSSNVTRIVGRAEDGQTMLIDKTTRTPSAARLASPRQTELFTPPRPGSQEESGAVPSSPPDALHSEARIIAVEVRVSDLDASARFYADLLGQNVQRGEGHFDLDNGLRLTQLRMPSTGVPTRGLVLTLTHPDPHALADRVLESNGQAAWSNKGASLWLKDPDGNSIRVTRAT